MKTLFKTTALALSMLVFLLTQQSCKKDDSSTTPTPQTPAFSIVGTWVLVSAEVVVNSKTSTISVADIAKTNAVQGSYPADDLVFTADGNYTRGKETGTWVLASSVQLKLKNSNSKLDIAYEFSNNDATTMQFGNSWDLIANPTPTVSQSDAPISAEALLKSVNVSFDKASLANVKYKVGYKKK